MACTVTSTLLLLAGAVFVATANSDVRFSYKIALSTGSIYSGVGVMSDVFITLTATADGSSAIAGQGLWKMSIFARNDINPDTADTLHVKNQVLNQTDQDLGVVADTDTIFDVTTRFELGEMGGCKGDYQYFCVKFGKGDQPNPDFVLEEGYEACLPLGFQCATAEEKEEPKEDEPIPDDQLDVKLKTSNFSLGWGYPGSGDETFQFTVQFSPLSRQNLQGKGLWCLGIFWSKTNDIGTSDRFDEQPQLLSEADSDKSLVDGKDLVFDVKTTFKEDQPGCGDDQYSFLCVSFQKGDNPNPDFGFGGGFNYCYKMCKEEEQEQN